MIVSAYPVVGRRPRVPLAIIRRVFGPVYADLRAMEAIVTGSALDWTIIRPVRLKDGPRTGQVTLTGGDLRRVPAVSRADLAQILLERAEASDPGRRGAQPGGRVTGRGPPAAGKASGGGPRGDPGRDR